MSLHLRSGCVDYRSLTTRHEARVESKLKSSMDIEGKILRNVLTWLSERENTRLRGLPRNKQSPLGEDTKGDDGAIQKDEELDKLGIYCYRNPGK